MLSVVIPVFNEQELIEPLYDRVSAAMDECGEDYEVLVVDDGSRDATPDLLLGLHQRDPRWKILFFSRNFGHQTAISAGIHHSQGDAVAVMDGDLQDPPEILPPMFAKWRSGFQVVYAIRRKRKENIFKRASYRLFYLTLRRLASIDVPLDAGDFCVMDRAVVDVLRAMPERTRFVRGLRSWAGFRQTGYEYERHARQAGQPKYTLIKLMRLAANGIVCFSSRPLRLAGFMGLTLCAASLLLIVLLGAWWISGMSILGARPTDSVGWTSLTSLVLLLSGLQMLMLGVFGEYLARVFDEVKQRPPWVIAHALGVPSRVVPSHELPSHGDADSAREAGRQLFEPPALDRPVVPETSSAADGLFPVHDHRS